MASRSRPSLDWGPAVLIEGDAAEGVAALKVSTTGVVMGTYEPAGEVVTGSF